MQHICLLSNLASQPHKASPRDQKNSLTSYFMLGINTWPWNWTLRRKNFWSRSWGDLHTYPSRSANTTWIGGRARSRYRESKQPFQVNYLYSLKERTCGEFVLVLSSEEVNPESGTFSCSVRSESITLPCPST